jgi:phage shock protein C
MKKLYKSRKNKVVDGVIGGFAEYVSADPVVLRIIFILLVIVTGVFPFLFIYLIAMLIIPKEPEIKETEIKVDHEVKNESSTN